MSYSIQAIDCVVNPITPEVLGLRPAWFSDFYSKKIGRDTSISAGLSHERMLSLMDAALKGLDDFLAMHRHAGARHDWIVAGAASADYDPAALAGLDVPAGWLDRATLLARIRAADYAFVAFRGEYELTASGSLLDCINQRKPVLAVRNTALDTLARQYGPIGHLCDDLAGVQALLDDEAQLRDAAAYARFQASLDAIARDRQPAALAATIRADFA